MIYDFQWKIGFPYWQVEDCETELRPTSLINL